MTLPDAGEATPKAPMTLETLPAELQREIVAHCSQGDLICLSLVSKHFRDLAAAQLYRNFHIVFPDEDDPAFDSPIDGLAGGLDTFVTSEYDYAKHLRDLSLDTLSAGAKAETAYKPYLFSVSCGKFMNTLLLLTLRKAKSLESFRWNIRVELSRPVYHALHQIKTISHLHIRLQAGTSLYETPPPLPYNQPHQPVTFTYTPTAAHIPGLAPPLQPPSWMVPPPPSLFYVPASNPPHPPAPKPAARAKAPKKASAVEEPPTLSGFKKLRSLAVLDIDNLDVVTELKTCVKNSAGTLVKLKLSFSDSLAMQARKPPPDIDPEDSDPDDEFQVVPVQPAGPSYSDEVSGPARAFRAQEEKKSQEAVLGRIFDVEPHVVKKAPKKPRDIKDISKEESSSTPSHDFIEAIKLVSAKLWKNVHGTGDVATAQQEVLNIIEAAARKYVTSHEAQRSDKKAGGSSAEASTSQTQQEVKTEDTTEAEPSVSLFDLPSPSKTKDAQKDADPDDINIEEPEEELVIESQDSPQDSSQDNNQEGSQDSTQDSTQDIQADDPATPVPESTAAIESPVSSGVDGTAITEAAQKDCKEHAADEEQKNVSQGIQDVQQEIKTSRDELPDVVTTGNEIQGAEKQEPAGALIDPEVQNQKMSDFLRTTHGLALQSLSIHLIPVKASVLSRAIDLRMLRRLTLLNVGPQAAIWTHLQKENKESPLPLRKIYTDNVTQAFLTCVSQLEEVHELFLLERDNKYKPEPFAPKTVTTIEQIRRTVLKKHMPTLKRLMIKHQSDTAWDMNEKTLMLICKRGKNLQELACNMGIKVVHTFMQQLSGLVSLRALHIVQLRNDDTCVWVMRETKRFLIDNLTHHPHLKLEWISIDDDDRVERLVRVSDLPKKDKKQSKKAKGKQKAKNGGPVTGNSPFPVLPSVDSWDNAASSDSESDDDDDKDRRIETVENIHFYDVWGVRIFKKEVVAGRL
ncbi:putative f-box domain-protein [Podospora conica]|nr:putative f-box domain-protein [Schizothecium conicum]